MKKHLYLFVSLIFLLLPACKIKKSKYDNPLTVSKRRPSVSMKEDANYLKKLKKNGKKEEKRLKRLQRKKARRRI